MTTKSKPVSPEDFQKLVEAVADLQKFRDMTIEKVNTMCDVENKNFENMNENFDNIAEDLEQFREWIIGAYKRLDSFMDAVNMWNLRLNTEAENPMNERTNGSVT